MNNKLAALLLAGVLCLSVMTGCSPSNETEKTTAPQTEQSDKKPNNKLTGNKENSDKEDTVEKHEPALVNGKIPLSEDGALESYYYWASDFFPEAELGVFSIGQSYGVSLGGGDFWDMIESQGVYPFMAKMGWDQYVSTNANDSLNVLCLTPTDPEAELIIQKCENGKPTEELYHSKNGDPVILICNAQQEQPDCLVQVKGDGKEPVTYSPKWDPVQKKLILSEGGKVFDYSIGAIDSTTATWQLYGQWEFTDEYGECFYILNLYPDLYMTYEEVTDYSAVSRSFEGRWDRVSEDSITFLTHPTATGVRPDDRVGTEVWEQEYKFIINPDGTMKLEKLRGEELFSVENPALRLTNANMFPRTIIDPEEEILIERAEARLKNYQFAQYGYCPDYVKYQRSTQIGPMIRLYDVATDDREITYGAYLVDIYTQTAYPYDDLNYSIDLEYYGGADVKTAELWDRDDNRALACQLVEEYYIRTFGKKPKFTAVDSLTEDGLLVMLTNDLHDQTQQLGWYMIDPLTGKGFDYMTLQPIDFKDKSASQTPEEKTLEPSTENEYTRTKGVWKMFGEDGTAFFEMDGQGGFFAYYASGAVEMQGTLEVQEDGIYLMKGSDGKEFNSFSFEDEKKIMINGGGGPEFVKTADEVPVG